MTFPPDTDHRTLVTATVLALALVAGLVAPPGCGLAPGIPLPDESTGRIDPDRFELVARLVHISDAHVTDEQSPGRMTAAAGFAPTAWRPQEAYSTQILDGVIRTINKLHIARHEIDFVIHTGDATDNAQFNELQWFITAFDGGLIDPRSGPDDRDPAALPDPLLDPHHPFAAQGLYRNGVHGPAPTIEWYNLFGNHDRFASGVFPIVTDLLGRRVSPLPLENRIGLFLPVVLDPTGRLSWAAISPANPGPPAPINFPVLVEPNPARRFVTDRHFIEAHQDSVTDPPGHGFAADSSHQTCYSVSPAPGVRLIALNSATPLVERPGAIYSEGAISWSQFRFLESELELADRREELVIVATHHPSDALAFTYGTALTSSAFRGLLNQHPSVKLHLAGHWHYNAVFDRGGYTEIVTGSIIDSPQQGRLIEIWQASRQVPDPPGDPEPRASAGANLRGDGHADASDDEIELRYWMFSHLDEIDPPGDAYSNLFDDPLLPLRHVAAELAAPAGDVESGVLHPQH